MKYIIGFLIFIGLIVLIIVLFASGGSKTPAKPTANLSRYANTSTVMQMIIDGPIGADQTHRSIKITVGESDATMDVIQGYQGTVMNHVSYANNQQSYNNFLRALDLAGFTKTRKTSVTDERGVCPQGNRNIFEIVNGVTDVQRTWNTTCSGYGNFGGNTVSVINLFQKQIPDYDKQTSSVSLGSSLSF